MQTNSSFSLRDLRVADLELFISAARLKNLGGAAALHNLSQSAASTAIVRVERAFGRPLCLHERRQFRLTREGQDLFIRAEKWLAQLRDILSEQECLPLRIVTTHALAQVCIPAILSTESVDLNLMRPDRAYGSVLRGDADVALVLDNAPWEGVIASEIGKGEFQLYSSMKEIAQCAVLLPEDQIEVLTLQQRFLQIYGRPLALKARLPSWSLIANICARSCEVGFLPDFLGQQAQLHPVSWQPAPTRYRILALYRTGSQELERRIDHLLRTWRMAFSGSSGL